MTNIIGLKKSIWPIEMRINGKIVKLNFDGSVEGDVEEFLEQAESFKGDIGEMGVPLWLVIKMIREEINKGEN
tara:strand:- start:755 stop:973 length:219 start_codon:yes stop_codon:yes gene_type:complete